MLFSNAEPTTFPPEIDPDFYRKTYADLSTLSDDQLIAHYRKNGGHEGRIASPAALRSEFIRLFKRVRPILEIGPLDTPMVTGRDVAYFDVLDTDALAAKARQHGRGGRVPHIDYVSPTGDLSVVDRTFAAVCSSHCIEHQPDLIAHLKAAAKILQPGGRYFMIVPDKRYCFDHFIPESTVGDVIDAHETPRSAHSLANIIKQVGISTHNDAGRHWKGDHEDPHYRTNRANRVREAIRRFRASNGGYLDAHAWRFTPDGFDEIIDTLHRTGYSPLRPARVHATPRGRVEFTAVLEKAA